MPWSADAPQAGFSDAAKTWLPVAAPHRALAVDRQLGQSDSLLAFFTQLLHWRREQPALIHGALDLLPGHPQVLAFVREVQREDNQQRLLCAFNFSDRPATLPLPAGWTGAALLAGSGLQGARVEGGTLHFEPWGGLHLQA